MADPVRIGKVLRGMEMREARAADDPAMITRLVNTLMDELQQGRECPQCGVAWPDGQARCPCCGAFASWSDGDDPECQD